MNLNWETGYYMSILICIIFSYLFTAIGIVKHSKFIPQDYKITFISYLIFVIINLLVFFNLESIKNIHHIVRISSTITETVFLISIYKKIIALSKLTILLIYSLIFTLIIVIYLKCINDLNNTKELISYFTIIYFTFSVLTLIFISIYLSKISAKLNNYSFHDKSLNLLIIGLFFGYGIPLPLDTIYSYLVIFEKPFYLELKLMEAKPIVYLKYSEVLVFVILNHLVIKSVKCFKLV
jgi:hypothetical protein